MHQNVCSVFFKKHFSFVLNKHEMPIKKSIQRYK